MPRLFEKRTSAASALRCWLQGEWEEVYSSGDYANGPEPMGPAPVKKEGRKPEDMEVVEMRLSACPIARPQASSPEPEAQR